MVLAGPGTRLKGGNYTAKIVNKLIRHTAILIKQVVQRQFFQTGKSVIGQQLYEFVLVL